MCKVRTVPSISKRRASLDRRTRCSPRRAAAALPRPRLQGPAARRRRLPEHGRRRPTAAVGLGAAHRPPGPPLSPTGAARPRHLPAHHTPHATTPHAPHPTAPSHLDDDADTLTEEAPTRAPSPKSSATFPEKIDPSRATLLRPRALLGGGQLPSAYGLSLRERTPPLLTGQDIHGAPHPRPLAPPPGNLPVYHPPPPAHSLNTFGGILFTTLPVGHLGVSRYKRRVSS